MTWEENNVLRGLGYQVWVPIQWESRGIKKEYEMLWADLLCTLLWQLGAPWKHHEPRMDSS